PCWIIVDLLHLVLRQGRGRTRAREAGSLEDKAVYLSSWRQPRGQRSVTLSTNAAMGTRSNWRGSHGSRDVGRCSALARRLDIEKLQAERLELVDDAVQRGLVGDRAGEQGVRSASACGQGRERLQDRRADRAADADLISSRLAATGRTLVSCHSRRIGVGWMS